MQIVKLDLTKNQIKNLNYMNSNGLVYDNNVVSNAITLDLENIYLNSECLFQFSSNTTLTVGKWYKLDCLKLIPSCDFSLKNFDIVELLVGGVFNLDKVEIDNDYTIKDSNNNLDYYDGVDWSTGVVSGTLLTVLNVEELEQYFRTYGYAYFKYDGNAYITAEFYR